MAGADYATVDDLRAHWPALEAEREAEAAQKLHEASVEIRALYPDVDARILAGSLDEDVPRLVVCRMVKRAMTAPDLAGAEGGVSTAQQSAGPFSTSLTFSNPDGAVFLSAADKRLLRTSRAGRKAWTIRPSGGAV